jgi:formate hydrogenlyase subunit 3/multisubunit Na+/H+ antiporter MnhD subunit
VLALAGATALVSGAVSLAKPYSAFPIPASVTTASVGSIAGVLALIRLVNPPDDLSLQLGAWLGLLACAGIVVGGYYGMQEERGTA